MNIKLKSKLKKVRKGTIKAVKVIGRIIKFLWKLIWDNMFLLLSAFYIIEYYQNKKDITYGVLSLLSLVLFGIEKLLNNLTDIYEEIYKIKQHEIKQVEILGKMAELLTTKRTIQNQTVIEKIELKGVTNAKELIKGLEKIEKENA